MNIDVTICEDIDAVAAKACALILEVSTRDGFKSVVLSGGNTPAAIYRKLARQCLDDPEKLERIRTVDWFFGDERCVSPEHERSNYRMARDELFRPLTITESRIHRMRGEHSNPEQAATEYETTIKSVFSSNNRKEVAFDLILLGMGEDGHTASLFPGRAALNVKGKLATATSMPETGENRITLTYDAINNSQEAVFIIVGSGKAERVREFLDSRNSEKAIPAAKVSPLRKLSLILDIFSAAQINSDSHTNPSP